MPFLDRPDSPRILIVDPNQLLTEALSARLTSAARATCHVFGSLEPALAVYAAIAPDLVVIETNLPGRTGIGAVARLWAEGPAPIVVLTDDNHLGISKYARRAGAVDVLSKCLPADEIIHCCIGAMRLAPPERIYADILGRAELSLQQIEILDFIVAGDTNAEIARRLGYSESNLKFMIGGLMRIARVRNRTNLANWWRDYDDQASASGNAPLRDRMDLTHPGSQCKDS